MKRKSHKKRSLQSPQAIKLFIHQVSTIFGSIELRKNLFFKLLAALRDKESLKANISQLFNYLSKNKPLKDTIDKVLFFRFMASTPDYDLYPQICSKN